jgi:competence protein ComEA
MNDWLQRYARVVGLLLVWALSLGAVAFVARRPAPVAVEIIPPPTATATPAPTATFTPAPLRVYVSGSVVRPDVYALDPGAIVRDAIAAAGGFRSDANREAINLATPLLDGAQVHVPPQAEVVVTPPAGVSAPAPTPEPPAAAVVPAAGVRAAPAGKININTASLAELDTLPGVGPVTAQRIVDGRPYAQIEDIKRVRGIGDATFEKLQPLITTQ